MTNHDKRRREIERRVNVIAVGVYIVWALTAIAVAIVALTMAGYRVLRVREVEMILLRRRKKNAS